LVIDEALAVGDAFFVQKCMRFLRRFMQHGTVLFVSHDTSSILNLCDYAIWLDHGRIAMEGTPKDVASAYLKAFFEAGQGESAEQTEGERQPAAERARPLPRDMRQDTINASDYRNDIEMFAFDPEAGGFGKGGALVEDVWLNDAGGHPLNWVVGGEEVTLSLSVRVQPGEELTRPIMGFYVKDRLGQTLFGDNTFISYQQCPVHGAAGSLMLANFSFRMPILPQGDYSISVAVADGTQHDHVQHHWLHDALFFKSHSSSQSHGLVGLPMHDIRLQVESTHE
jgi:lipopolysaccharide transport system ATP-binding protein